jgi:hypothetical protein
LDDRGDKSTKPARRQRSGAAVYWTIATVGSQNQPAASAAVRGCIGGSPQ